MNELQSQGVVDAYESKDYLRKLQEDYHEQINQFYTQYVSPVDEAAGEEKVPSCGML